MVAHGAFGHLLRGLGRQTILGLANECRIADKARHQCAATRHQIITGDLRRFLVVDQLTIGLDALQDRGPETGDMGAAFGGGDGVTIGLGEAVA